jgi:predicted RNA-binding Zn-ribbon protein involved in translation (DUF1610 family)
MSRYPRDARNAQMKCIDCNAPVVKTTDEEFVCVDCGSSPVQRSPTLDTSA